MKNQKKTELVLGKVVDCARATKPISDAEDPGGD